MAEQSQKRLTELIDEAAAGLVLSETVGAPEALATLSAAFHLIREEASKAGRDDIAGRAAAVAARIEESRNGAAELDGLAQAVECGVTDMQAAMAVAADAPRAAGDIPSIAQDADLVQEILLETSEHLNSVEARLLAIERNPSDQEAVHALFRSFHSVKGLAGFLELPPAQEIAHEIETVLDRVRNSEMSITAPIVDLVLASKDYLASAFSGLEPLTRGEPMRAALPHGTLRDRIRRVASQAAAPSMPEEAKAPEPASADTTKQEPAELAASAKTEAKYVKIDTAKLDYLVDMAGEMVIAESQVRHDPGIGSVESPRLQRNLAQLARTTAELQRTAMSMRMVPVAQLFRRMPRLVRDLSRRAGKQVELEMAGEDTELDRTIVEELGDPLIHMVRNSVDHGIETPDERLAAGKPATGILALKASHQAGHIRIEISDDGRGIDKDKVLAKAIRQGLAAEGSRPSDTELFNLIFEPGFSTAEKITDVSGRGVGMDVVKRHVQRLRGRIEVQSSPGRGTNFVLKLPLTLAIIEGLVVGVGRERYIVPLFAVRETFRPTPDMIATACGRGEMVLVRNHLLPFIRLYHRFGVEPRTEDPCRSVFIVAENGGRLFCLMVDEFTGKQEVVIKSMGEMMKNIAGVAGGAILGDGRVGLVLDLEGIFEQCNA